MALNLSSLPRRRESSGFNFQDFRATATIVDSRLRGNDDTWINLACHRLGASLPVAKPASRMGA